MKIENILSTKKNRRTTLERLNKAVDELKKWRERRKPKKEEPIPEPEEETKIYSVSVLLFYKLDT